MSIDNADATISHDWDIAIIGLSAKEAQMLICQHGGSRKRMPSISKGFSV